MPDKADFVLYGTLKSKMRCKSMQKFFEHKFSARVKDWYYSMAALCKNESENRISTYGPN